MENRVLLIAYDCDPIDLPVLSEKLAPLKATLISIGPGREPPYRWELYLHLPPTETRRAKKIIEEIGRLLKPQLPSPVRIAWNDSAENKR